MCKRRRAAAVATHNLDNMTPPLRYECHAAIDINLVPLNWSKKVTGFHYLKYLEGCKTDKRGGGGKKGRGGGGAKKVEPAKEADPVGAALSKYVLVTGKHDKQANCFLGSVLAHLIHPFTFILHLDLSELSS